MYDLSGAGPVTWIEFPNPEYNDVDHKIRVNLSFLASNWACQFGRGCPGMFGPESEHTAPDLGCCTEGFVVADGELDAIEDRIAMLTDDDWDKELRAEYTKQGKWYTGSKDKNSLVVNGGCIFANRYGGSSGKIGCAFLHLGDRVTKDRHDIGDNSIEHKNFMPRVCWQLPLNVIYPDDNTIVLTVWSTSTWTGDQPTDENYESKFPHWWCTDSTSAYNGRRMLVDSMQAEITEILGKASYDIIRAAIGDGSNILPMPASPAGRKIMQLLPTRTIEQQVGSRTPIRNPV